MSREIKFRAWDSYNESLVKVLELKFDAKIAYVESLRELNEGERYDISFDNLKLLQYTGLKDKNGVEIYEGHILKTFSNINKYTDSFAEDIEPKFEYTTIVRDGACFKTTYKGRPSYVLNENSGSTVEHMEVVGNIYENKNLLEEK